MYMYMYIHINMFKYMHMYICMYIYICISCLTHAQCSSNRDIPMNGIQYIANIHTFTYIR